MMHGTTSITFADDFTILIRARTIEECIIRTQRVPEIITEWENVSNVAMNPHKTKWVLLSKKHYRNTVTPQSPRPTNNRQGNYRREGIHHQMNVWTVGPISRTLNQPPMYLRKQLPFRDLKKMYYHFFFNETTTSSRFLSSQTVGRRVVISRLAATPKKNPHSDRQKTGTDPE